jgi:hypothetical protein
LDSACNLSTSAIAAVPSMLRIEQLMQRFAFYIDSEQNKACNFHVALRLLTKGVLFARQHGRYWRREKI